MHKNWFLLALKKRSSSYLVAKVQNRKKEGFHLNRFARERSEGALLTTNLSLLFVPFTLLVILFRRSIVRDSRERAFKYSNVGCIFHTLTDVVCYGSFVCYAVGK